MPRIDLFFPVALLIIAAMIYAAIAPGVAQRREREIEVARTVRDGFVAEGEALAQATAAPGATVTYLADAEPPRLLARANRSFAGRSQSAGVYLPIAPPLMSALAELDVRVTITARPAQANPAGRFRAAFMIYNGRGSDWMSFRAGADEQDFVIDWTPPDDPLDRPGLVAVWPDDEGLGLGLEITRIRIDALDAPASAQGSAAGAS